MKQVVERFAVVPSDESDLEDFELLDSVGRAPKTSWYRFCNPSLRREAYEADGFKAKKVRITIEVIEE